MQRTLNLNTFLLYSIALIFHLYSAKFYISILICSYLHYTVTLFLFILSYHITLLSYFVKNVLCFILSHCYVLFYRITLLQLSRRKILQMVTPDVMK